MSNQQETELIVAPDLGVKTPAWDVKHAVRVNLLPPQVAERRRADTIRTLSLFAVVLATVLVATGFVTVLLINNAAAARLDVVQDRNDTLLAEQRSYSEVSGILGEIATAQTQLTALLADDVSPAAVTRAIRDAAPPGLAVTSITLTVPGVGTEGAAGAASGALDDSGLEQLGRADITGSAPDQVAIAAYLAALGEADGFAVPYVVSVRSIEGVTEFTAQVTITSDARTLRFAEEGE